MRADEREERAGGGRRETRESTGERSSCWRGIILLHFGV